MVFEDKLSSEKEPEEKKRILQNDFGIRMTKKLEREVSQMCNLSQGIREKGRAEGRAQGGTEKEEKIILNMHTNNFTLEQIALATGRGIEDIRAIIEKKEPQMV